MSDREEQRIEFLKGAGLADARRDPLPGDASTRRYERLTTPTGASLMLMDQASSAESLPSATSARARALRRLARPNKARSPVSPEGVRSTMCGGFLSSNRTIIPCLCAMIPP